MPNMDPWINQQNSSNRNKEYTRRSNYYILKNSFYFILLQTSILNLITKNLNNHFFALVNNLG